MPDFETDTERRAYAHGVDAANAAASWIIDGNTSREHIERLARMMDEGDPALDQYLPARPNLSGEWADALTPRKLALEIEPMLEDGDIYSGDDADSLESAIADAWEQGVSDAFGDECERLVKEALDG